QFRSRMSANSRGRGWNSQIRGQASEAGNLLFRLSSIAVDLKSQAEVSGAVFPAIPSSPLSSRQFLLSLAAPPSDRRSCSARTPLPIPLGHEEQIELPIEHQVEPACASSAPGVAHER